MGLQLHRDFNDGTSAPLAISLSTRHSFSTSKAPHPSYLSSCEAARLTQWPSGDRPILGSGHAGRCRLTRPLAPCGSGREGVFAEGVAPSGRYPPRAGLGLLLGHLRRCAVAPRRDFAPYSPILPTADPACALPLCSQAPPLRVAALADGVGPKASVRGISTPPLSPTSPTSPPPVASDFPRCAPRAIFRSSTCAGVRTRVRGR